MIALLRNFLQPLNMQKQLLCERMFLFHLKFLPGCLLSALYAMGKRWRYLVAYLDIV